MKVNLFLAVLISMIFVAIPHESFSQKKKKKSRKDFVVTIHTRLGNMQLILFDETPKHKENFLKLADEGFFDSTTFHRVIREFMIQGGDPNSKPGGDSRLIGQGGPGYTVDAEIVDTYKHTKGALAAARQGDRVNPTKASSGSQFYIVHNPDRCKHLNGDYTVYGQVIQGLDIIDKIAQEPVNRRGDRLIEEVYMTVTVEKMSKKKITKLYGYGYEG